MFVMFLGRVGTLTILFAFTGTEGKKIYVCRRKNHYIKGVRIMNKNFVVIGCGRFGTSVATTLYDLGYGNGD